MVIMRARTSSGDPNALRQAQDSIAVNRGDGPTFDGS
mgnify:FL=1